MLGEYLSIETSSKIARLEKENIQLSESLIKYDIEVNKLDKDKKLYLELIKELITYIKKQFKELEEVDVVDDGTYSNAKETYIKLLEKLEVSNNDD